MIIVRGYITSKNFKKGDQSLAEEDVILAQANLNIQDDIWNEWR